jgi:hypothetical protein
MCRRDVCGGRFAWRRMLKMKWRDLVGGWSLPPKLCLTAIFVGGCLAGSDARDLGQWKSNDPRLSQWFRGLMQPDTIPPVSCCGEADAYWADQVRVGPNGEIIAAITDDREDGPLRRMHEDIGNKYIVPPNKIIKKNVHPTGHAIIFLGTSSIFGLRSEPRPVLCYVMNGEV